MSDRFYISKLLTVLFIAGWACCTTVKAQEIDFSVYSDYGLNVFINSNQTMVFGENGQVISGEGTIEIPISSGDKTIIAIEGVKFLDVVVEIFGPRYLYKNGNTSSSQRIPFNLKAAYANMGQDNYSQARIIPVASDNSATARFRIRGRGEGPPGPPPVPPHGDYKPPKDQAYLYLYGSIDVGEVDAGDYYSTIDITVRYPQSN